MIKRIDRSEPRDAEIFALVNALVRALAEKIKVSPERIFGVIRDKTQRRQKKCVVCGKIFVHTWGQNAKRTCSPACAKERHRLRNEELRSGGEGKHLGWHRELAAALQDRALAQDEQWLAISEAAKKSGLSMMQIIWLGTRSMIHVRGDTRRRWGNRPVRLYAASELDIAKKVYEEWKKRKAAAEKI